MKITIPVTHQKRCKQGYYAVAGADAIWCKTRQEAMDVVLWIAESFRFRVITYKQKHRGKQHLITAKELAARQHRSTK